VFLLNGVRTAGLLLRALPPAAPYPHYVIAPGALIACAAVVQKLSHRTTIISHAATAVGIPKVSYFNRTRPDLDGSPESHGYLRGYAPPSRATRRATHHTLPLDHPRDCTAGVGRIPSDGAMVKYNDI
jgi:hypothetical protein